MASYSVNTPYLVLSGVVLLALVAIFVVYQPQVQAIAETRAQLKATQERLSEREDFWRSLESKIATLRTEEQHERQLDVVLPAREAMEDVLRVVHAAVNDAGAVVVGVENTTDSERNARNIQLSREGRDAVASPISTAGLKVTFIGSYAQLRQSLEALQQSPRLLDITHLAIEADEQQLDVVRAIISIRFYSYSGVDN